MFTTHKRLAYTLVWFLNHIPFGPRFEIEVITEPVFDPAPVVYLSPVPDLEDPDADSAPE